MRGLFPITVGVLLAIHASRPAEATGAEDLTSAANKAAHELTSAAKDALLLKDLMGAAVKGPNGQVVATVENLVVVPGGRLVAAVLKPKDGNADRLVVPYQVVKVARTAGKVEASLPVGLSALNGSKAVKALADAVPISEP